MPRIFADAPQNCYFWGVETKKGKVIKNTGSWYGVLTPDGSVVNSKVKGNFRLRGIRTTNPVAVGDDVEIEINPSGTAFITRIEPRRNYIIRRASNLSKEAHIIASNLDQTMLVVSLREPATSTTFIDRFLATAEAYSVLAVLIINKVDLLEGDDAELCDAVAYLYESIGYRVVRTSAESGEGVDQLRELLRGKISLLSGNSGVGKSSLINRLLPGLNLRTAAISALHHTGMHTTTFSEMYHFDDEGGFIIDTPGVKGFGTIDFDAAETGHYFPEIFKASSDCRYNNCTHTHEPGCAVRAAVEEHLISESRYASYLSILDDSADDKYRKPY